MKQVCMKTNMTRLLVFRKLWWVFTAYNTITCPFEVKFIFYLILQSANEEMTNQSAPEELTNQSSREEPTNQSTHEEVTNQSSRDDQRCYDDAAEVLEEIVQFAEAACQ